MTITATYDPADDKIRVYPSARLDAETYTKVKAAGYSWAPRQSCFYAVWSPIREDIATELADNGEIGDEDTTLAERADARAERFEGYQDKRAAEAERAAEAVSEIAGNIPFGQPILVGHHSEKRARRDAAKIENGMRKTVKLWATSEYWQRRAAEVLGHAEYKERPDVRARRIKSLEADERRLRKTRETSIAFRAMWQGVSTSEAARKVANVDHGAGYHLWSRLDKGQLTAETARAEAVASHDATIADADRWLAHLGNRLGYERALLAESGYTPPPKKRSKAELPLLNIRGKVSYHETCGGKPEIVETEAVAMTKAEFARIPTDYKGTRVSADGAYRLRLACRVRPGEYDRSIVFLTDSKEHERPAPGAPALPNPDDEARAEHERRADFAAEACIATQRHSMLHGRAPAPAPPAAVAAVKASLAAGVQVVSAPNLFVTPPELAARMVALLKLTPDTRVLEPSAGTGALLHALRANPILVRGTFAVEINYKLVEVLHTKFYEFARVYASDFLNLAPGEPFPGYFDAALMNPPFDHGSDVAHIEHALTFLKPGGVLVGICTNGPKQNERLRPMAESWEDLPAETFAGTSVQAALIVIRKDES